MIPQRQPLEDTVRGQVLRLGATVLLTTAPSPQAETLHDGEMVIRYGIEVLGKPHLSIVPGLVALDYGDMLTGEDAWQFLLKRSHMHPRADVVGYRSDGVDDMTVVKALDIVQPVHVLAYTDSTNQRPFTRLHGLITTTPTHFPPRLLEYLPVYATLKDWQTHHD